MKLVSTLMRVVLGIIFLAHGIAKLKMGVSNVSEWFISIDLPGFMAYVVAYVELIGGIALIVGLFTKFLSVCYTLMLLGAIIWVKLPLGLLGGDSGAGYELDLSLVALLLYFVFSEESGFGISQLMNKKTMKD